MVLSSPSPHEDLPNLLFAEGTLTQESRKNFLLLLLLCCFLPNDTNL
ncbi:hypothetical protein CP10881SC42_0458 [Chlamydia avium]|uniref:Uncharacterized protein n=1 Tax=Chlamydia avium TaxID=1457141 RepID=A0ABP2X6W9_9CHLA|nr:hypothetical protein CP10743SC13_0370 [Chlamydia psittaci 10_743_SC13]EPP38575.1 hypothetical protein CP10881SC42_0458 [Chlamydia avium]